MMFIHSVLFLIQKHETEEHDCAYDEHDKNTRTERPQNNGKKIVQYAHGFSLY